MIEIEPAARKRVFGFFVAKGYLIAPHIQPQPNVKLRMPDVLALARDFEPRLNEVLPAAVIHFPRTFLQKETLPQELWDIIAAIKAGKREFNDYRGIKYQDMFRWANRTLPDKRTKPERQRKILCAHRFSSTTLKKLRLLARRQGKTRTEVLEGLVREAARG